MKPLDSIREQLRGDDPLLDETLQAPLAGIEVGPTERLQPEVGREIRVGVEAIREGHLLHWGKGRVVVTHDSDLALLAGDRLYAMGLERVAATGNVTAIRQLSRLIKASAEAQAAGLGDASEAEWASTCETVGVEAL